MMMIDDLAMIKLSEDGWMEMEELRIGLEILFV